MKELFDRLNKDVVSYMKSGNATGRDCLRCIISEVKNLTINQGKEITDEVVLKVLQKSLKSHKESIEQFKSADRKDLIDKEVAELNIIETYLPKALSNEEIIAAIDKIISDENIPLVKKSMGIIMKKLSSVSGVDKKVASSYINSILK